jgi:hypothetical protein
LEDPAVKIQRHLHNGIIVDSGVLVIFFAGLYQDTTGYSLWQTLKETKNRYKREDYDFLSGLLTQFRMQVVTPHILTEVSNMLGQLHEPADKQCRGLMMDIVPSLEEHSVEASEIISDEAFSDFGVTDTGICHAAATPYLVLTIDRPLSGYLDKAGIDSLLFDNIRYAT